MTRSIGKRKGAGAYFKQTIFSMEKVAGFVVTEISAIVYVKQSYFL